MNTSRYTWPAVVLVLAALCGATVSVSADCPKVSYATERAKLQKFLTSNGYSRAERSFLTRGVEQRLGEVSRSRLNERGAACGIRTVRALILGCMNETLPSVLRSTPSPDRKSATTQWGKSGLSGRELAVVSMLHACREAAAETLMTGQ